MSTTDTPSLSAMSAAREILNAIFLPISKAMLEPYSPDPADVVLVSEIIDRELAAAKARNAQLERAYDRLAMQLARLEGLEQDKARLDWLEDDQNRTLLAFTLYASQTYREGIDAARKEAKS
jgi:hypothetical protein